MIASDDERPTESDATAIARNLYGTIPESIYLFSEGLGHWIYDVGMRGGSKFGFPE
jgi:hypothetical protein